jgi:hypothetical protein
MKLIIIPDLHGDFEEFYNILKSFGITNQLFEDFTHGLFLKPIFFKKNFNLSNYKLVFLGDLLDSTMRESEPNLLKYSDMYVFYLANYLKENFPNNIILILGNHELMNMYSLFDYVNEYSVRSKNTLNYIRNKIKKNFLLSYKYNNICFTHADVLEENIENEILTFLRNDDKYIYDNNIIEIYNILYYRRINSKYNEKTYNKYKYICFGHSVVDDIKFIKNQIYIDQAISKSFGISKKKYKIICFDENNKCDYLEITRSDYNVNYMHDFLKKFDGYFNSI